MSGKYRNKSVFFIVLISFGLWVYADKPQWVEGSTKALKDSVKKYVFISSISVYKDLSKKDFDEDTEVERLSPEQEERFAKIDPEGEFNAADLGDMYGALKILCEEEVKKTFPGNSVIIPPGLIVGEYDFTDRFSYWVTTQVLDLMGALSKN